MSQDAASPHPKDGASPPSKYPDFPASSAPRVWLLSDGLSPIAVGLSRRLLEHGDCVVAGVLADEFAAPRGDALRELIREGQEQGGIGEASSVARIMEKRWMDRLRTVELDGRHVGQMQAGIAEAIELFGHIDILLLCRSETLIGTVEELSQSGRTRSLIMDQFETNFYAPVNIIKAVLPLMREKKNGHIIVLTGVTAHLGTPGLGIYCASQWALEGYCDSLAYEIAPFNIKLTIVQPNMEISVFTNKLITTPTHPAYTPAANSAPLARTIFQRLLDSISPASSPEQLLAAPRHISTLYSALPSTMQQELVGETVFALAAVGGHENPPARLIVGFEGIASVKEKLRTISEELEDFIEVSEQVDLPLEDEVRAAAGGEEDADADADADADFMEVDLE